ncbi:MFS transporter [Rhizobacter sp. LjRoot28]|uniref:MFS transporter n=1 Tax=Rhizobacter sp. LjRoot28 TaxID=3342309 RepID=UPI003ECEB0CA
MSPVTSRVDPVALQWPGTLLLILAGVVSAFHVGKATAVMEALRQDLSLSLTTAAWLLSVSGAVGAVAGIGVGMIVDRLGPRRMAVLGLAVQALASAGGAWAAHPTALLASRVVEGLGFQLVVVAVPALIAGATPVRSRATAMAAWSTFMPVGLALALLSAPRLAPGSWASLWWFASALAIAVAAAVARLTPELPRLASVARRDVARDLRTAWHARAPMLLALLFGLFNAGYFALFGLLPSVMQKASAIDDLPPHLFTAVAVLASAGGNLAGLALIARGVRPLTLLASGFAAMAVLSYPVVLDMGEASSLSVAASIAFGAAAGLIPSALFAEAPRCTPTEGMQGLVIGLMMQGGNVGMTVGPPIAALATAAWDGPAAAGVVTALGVAGIGAAMGLQRPRRGGMPSPVQGNG